MRIRHPPRSSSVKIRARLSRPGRDGRNFAGAFYVNGTEVSRPDNFEIFHVGRIIEEVVNDARSLVDTVPSGDKRHLVLIHEFGPALHHNDDLKIGDVLVPSGA